MDAAFEKLALKMGIELPERLSTLIAIAQSDKGTMRSVYDLFWLDAKESEREIDEWLNPEDQQGRTFLPFARLMVAVSLIASCGWRMARPVLPKHCITAR